MYQAVLKEDPSNKGTSDIPHGNYEIESEDEIFGQENTSEASFINKKLSSLDVTSSTPQNADTIQENNDSVTSPSPMTAMSTSQILRQELHPSHGVKASRLSSMPALSLSPRPRPAQQPYISPFPPTDTSLPKPP